MTLEDIKATALRLPEEISKGNMGIFDQVVAPNAVEHAVPPGFPQTVEGTKKFFTMFLSAFPDLKYHVEDTIAEGDLVTQRLTARATMKGAFLGMPATGKAATWSEIHIVRFANGKVVEHWATVDQLGMLQQLGLAPTASGN